MVAAPKLKSSIGSLRSRSGSSPILTEIRPLPKTHMPLWQKTLVGLQWVSGVAAASSMVALLPLYGWLALCEQQWSRAYHQLEQLKRQERELLVSHETLRYRVTQQVQQAPQGLVPQNPQRVLFVPNQASTGATLPVQIPSVAVAPHRRVSY